MENPVGSPEEPSVTPVATPAVTPEVTPEVAPAAAKPKRVRTKKTEEAPKATSEPSTPPKATYWSVGFTIVDN